MSQPLRIMWLLNHTSARKFEIAMLKNLGYSEIFLPKKYPTEVSFIRSASIDYSEDANLTIPAEDLVILNNADWYKGAKKHEWEIANKYFKIIFFIAFYKEIIPSICQNFVGIALWRVYGFENAMSCDFILRHFSENYLSQIAEIEKMGNRFYFCEAFAHIHLKESYFLRQRRLCLPIGMHKCDDGSNWEGKIKKLFFVCPDINTNPYYNKIYTDFCDNFKGIPYEIGGGQPLPVSDPNVLGFVTNEKHHENMKQMRVMFYHSREPSHVHYHPFEAISNGMPLIFMSGGILEKFGGINQPGLCSNIKEARHKIQRLLSGDANFIAHIRKEQTRILDAMRPENCIAEWRRGFKQIEQVLSEKPHVDAIHFPKSKNRIAVILPEAYQGGSFRLAKLIAHAVLAGSKASGEEAEVVFAHLDKPDLYSDEDFEDLPSGIKRRTFSWRILTKVEASNAMILARMESDLLEHYYTVPDDGINNFLDCNAWIIISDRIQYPLLKIRPYICFLCDYLQRYDSYVLHGDTPDSFLNFVRTANAVLVSTEFTKKDVLNYAGVSPEKVYKMPILAPQFQRKSSIQIRNKNYFIWTTNAASHKNHSNALLALQEYYEILGGKLKCIITGVNTKNFLTGNYVNSHACAEVVNQSEMLRCNLEWLGQLSDRVYQEKLAQAAFLWHPACIDNGTFSVIEAAQLGVPSLASDYPPMREIDSQYNLKLQWMDPHKPIQMAYKLKWMEEHWEELNKHLPERFQSAKNTIENLAIPYWKAVQECL